MLLLLWQGVLKHRWSVLYLLLSLSEDPRKPASRVSDQRPGVPVGPADSVWSGLTFSP